MEADMCGCDGLRHMKLGKGAATAAWDHVLTEGKQGCCVVFKQIEVKNEQRIFSADT